MSHKQTDNFNESQIDQIVSEDELPAALSEPQVAPSAEEMEDMGKDVIRDILVELGHSTGEITNALVERTILNILWSSLPKWKGEVKAF